MKEKIHFLFVLAFAFISCEDKNEMVDCEQEMLLEYNMMAYEGQEIQGQFFLSAMEFEGTTYFQLESHLADIQWDPVDCNGISFCSANGQERCSELETQATNRRIIGIQL